jgi:hypothetical protein
MFSHSLLTMFIATLCTNIEGGQDPGNYYIYHKEAVPFMQLRSTLIENNQPQTKTIGDSTP